MLSFFKFIDELIERLTKYLLVSSVLTMLFLSVLNIVLRWFNTTFLWVEPCVRHLVFLCAFLGGVIATGRGTHIAIDVVSKSLEGTKKSKIKGFLEKMIAFVSGGTVLWLLKASFDFMKVEAEYGRPVFFGIHSSVLVGIIPFGLLLISYRFFYIFICSFTESDNQTGGESC